MQVIEQHHQRCGGGRVGQVMDDRLELPQGGTDHVHVVHEPAGVAVQKVGHLSRYRTLREAAARGPQHLLPEPQRWCGDVLGAGAPEHRNPRQLGETPQQAGLADPRLPGHRDHPPPAGRRRGQRLDQLPHGQLTTDEDLPVRGRRGRRLGRAGPRWRRWLGGHCEGRDGWGRVPVQSRSLVQDLALEVLKRRLRVDAQFRRQQLLDGPQHSQCVGLPPGPVQRQAQQLIAVLAQRIGLYEGLQFAHRHPMGPHGQQCRAACLDHR